MCHECEVFLIPTGHGEICNIRAVPLTWPEVGVTDDICLSCGVKKEEWLLEMRSAEYDEDEVSAEQWTATSWYLVKEQRDALLNIEDAIKWHWLDLQEEGSHGL